MKLNPGQAAVGRAAQGFLPGWGGEAGVVVGKQVAQRRGKEPQRALRRLFSRVAIILDLFFKSAA